MRFSEQMLVGPAGTTSSSAPAKPVSFDADVQPVLTSNCTPARVSASEDSLAERNDLNAEGYTFESLTGGDYVVRVRHSASAEVRVAGSQRGSVVNRSDLAGTGPAIVR